MSQEAKIGVEIERKYIIRMPDISVLKTQPEYTVSDITQIYVTPVDCDTHRVRQRAYPDRVLFVETRKTRIDSISVTEIEGEISEARFNELRDNILDGSSPVIKTRHTFLYEGQIFEIDIYPQWKNTAIMETELKDREERAKIPEFIEILREVTGIKEYSNASMSLSFPKEII